ncbi:Uracil DNA glycosylase superfamily protein [Roseivivax marinus]|uniref:uracil-DNA glycosylase n=1 Tax=Roseivivax marinus TaxID=1379903 RepID=UPI0008C9CAD3|nr:uracil-DNA glycosylase [Roseivivax marinus]SEL48959.1 Uracil DNA glycosylase superfamily protein [Roseivivax marinus]
MIGADAAPLADPAEAVRRRAMLEAPHIAALTRYARSLERPGVSVPDFDPCDGGVGARLLFVMEKPGPVVFGQGGAGFVTRDDPSPTQRAARRFLSEAGIDRRDTVIWNVVPWWNGTTRVTAAELRAGAAAFEGLLELLHALRVAVLVGRKAERVRPALEARGIPVLASAHPSHQVRAAFPDRWVAIPRVWADAARYLTD